MNALSETSWGKEAINNAIESDGQGGYNVTFYNAEGEQERAISESSDELAATPEKYSSGDVDMKIIEVAAEKFYAAHADEDAYSFKNKDNPLTEGLMEGKTSLAYMLTGSEGHVLQSSKLDERIPDSALASDRAKLTEASLTKALLDIASSSDQYASMCSFKKQGFFGQLFGNSDVVADHGYSISSVLQNSSGGIEAVILKNHGTAPKKLLCLLMTSNPELHILSATIKMTFFKKAVCDFLLVFSKTSANGIIGSILYPQSSDSAPPIEKSSS